ncbi:MAG: hypothetical protein ACLRFE_03760, partial [Clostridia bacterium]
IRYYKFLLISILARGVGLATISFLGSGKVIPFSGWGIAVWSVIAVMVIGLLIFALKKRDKIKQFLHIDTSKK